MRSDKLHFNMNDPTAFTVQMCVTLLSLMASAWLGWRRRGPWGFGRIAASLGLALLIGFVFTFAAVYANAICRTELHLCREHGDANMSYWFFPLFAAPLHWALLLAFGPKNETYTFVPSPFDAVVDSAVQQFRLGGQAVQRCPTCKAVLALHTTRAPGNTGQKRLRVSCACSRCDRVFDLAEPA